MTLFVDLQKMFEVKMRVFLCGCQALMAKELLDNSQIRSSAQEVGSKGVAEGVRTYLPSQS